MRRWTMSMALVALVGAASGCEVVDRVRAGRGEAAPDTVAPSGGVTLNLESPGVVRPGQEVAIRLGVTNRGDTAVSGLRAELVVPGWMEPLPPEPQGTEATMVATGEGTQLSYRVAEPPLQPGESRSIVQRVRTPGAGLAGRELSPARTVRARLIGPTGQALSEFASDLVVDTTGALGIDTLAPGGARPAGEAAVVSQDGIAALRLGMTASDVRRRYPEARDTSWTAEGMTERGLVVPLADTAAARGRGRAVALLENDQVSRIHLFESEVRTGEGLGIGSRLEELRGAYGQECADVGERGQVVVWFAEKPGISWVLDARAPANPEVMRRDPSQLPGSAVVRELFVRRGTGRC